METLLAFIILIHKHIQKQMLKTNQNQENYKIMSNRNISPRYGEVKHDNGVRINIMDILGLNWLMHFVVNI